MAKIKDSFGIDFTIEDSKYDGKYLEYLEFEDGWKDDKRGILKQAEEILINLFKEKFIQSEYYMWQVGEKLTKRGKHLRNHWEINGKIFYVDIYLSTVWHGEYSLRRFLPYKASLHDIKLVNMDNYIFDGVFLYNKKI